MSYDHAEVRLSPPPLTPPLLEDIAGEAALSNTTHHPPAKSSYALPDSSLNFLGQIVQRFGIRRIFEFGTGRSTCLFLNSGCQVTSIENSEDWLNQTANSLAPQLRSAFRPSLLPLRTVFVGTTPVRSWPLNPSTIQHLREAELVLIDSPAYPPFREHALVQCLRLASQSLIVVDDAKIPTVHRFCSRLAQKNSLRHFYTPIDHGLFVFLPLSAPTPIDTGRSLWETLKGWRRFGLAWSADRLAPRTSANHERSL